MLCTKLLMGIFSPVLLTAVLILGSADEPPAPDSPPEPTVLVAISPVEALDETVLTLDEVLRQGERTYWRSCVNCHGTQPQMSHADQPQRFVEIVRNGSGEMPGLGYKLNAVEAEMVRWYLGQCSSGPQLC